MTHTHPIIVAIDGCSSCGKSTMAKDLAAYSGYTYVDTGAMYRAVALCALRNGWMTHDSVDEEQLRRHMGEMHITFLRRPDGTGQDTCLNGENVESLIRTLDVANAASRISAIGFVRSEMVSQQQRMGQAKGIVMDGRDIGTVVFPQAELKLFLTARPEVRAMRRYKELQAKGETATFDAVLANVKERDHRDTHRSESPLRKADDAVEIDNSDLTREEQSALLRRLFDERTAAVAHNPSGKIVIDEGSGFCFGVVNAIKKAEEELAKGEPLYCLGDIVHNGREVERLAKLGLITIDHERFERLHDVKVLLRAHGEPPSTYETARRNRITIIDASCPVVLRLQSKIKKKYQETDTDTHQIVIYGKKGHAEVVGLEGQTGNTAIVVEHEDDLDGLDFGKDISLFSQTTKSLDGFNRLVGSIAGRFQGTHFDYFDTICRQVANRIPNIIAFAKANDCVFFVGGIKSSNGKVLYEHCRKANPNTVFISGPDELTDEHVAACRGRSVGICGATSTPFWLMADVKATLERKLQE